MRNDALRDLYVNMTTTPLFYLSSWITYNMRGMQTAVNAHINLRMCVCVSGNFEQWQVFFGWCRVIKSHESWSLKASQWRWQTNTDGEMKFGWEVRGRENRKSEEMNLLTTIITGQHRRGTVKYSCQESVIIIQWCTGMHFYLTGVLQKDEVRALQN